MGRLVGTFVGVRVGVFVAVGEGVLVGVGVAGRLPPPHPTKPTTKTRAR